MYVLVGYFVNDPHFGLSNVFLMGYSRVTGFFFLLLNYEGMITFLQETWKLHNKIMYRSTICCIIF